MGARLGRTYPTHRVLRKILIPVLFDAVGSGGGAVGPTGSTWTTNLTATGGSYVIGIIDTFGNSFSNVKYGGNNMTLLTSTSGIGVFGLANAPGGTQAFSGSRTSNSSWRANAISFMNVGSIDPTIGSVSGSTGAASQTVSCLVGQHIFQVFVQNATSGATMSSLSGGTNQVNSNSITINDATTSTTFSGVTTSSWVGISLVLNHI